MDIIGLTNVDGEKLVLSAFLNIKFTMSNIGQSAIYKHNAFSIVNFCFKLFIIHFL